MSMPQVLDVEVIDGAARTNDGATPSAIKRGADYAVMWPFGNCGRLPGGGPARPCCRRRWLGPARYL